MEYETIIFEKENKIGTITLNQPEKLNVFGYKMREELLDAFKYLAGDSSIRVVVLTAAGRAFSAGTDLREGFLNGKGTCPRLAR